MLEYYSNICACYRTILRVAIAALSTEESSADKENTENPGAVQSGILRLLFFIAVKRDNNI